MRLQNKLRLTAVLLLIAFCMPLVSFAVYELNSAGNASQLEAMDTGDSLIPTDITAIYADDFSDDVIDSRITTDRFYTDDPVDTLVESDGKLTFTRSKWIWYTDSTAGEPGVRLYANTDKSGLTGKILIKFSLTKTREVVRARIADKNGNYITQIQWEGNTLTVYAGDKNYTASVDAGSTLDMAIYSDISSTKPKFTLWANNSVVADNVPSYQTISNEGITNIRFYTLVYANYGKNGNYILDDFGFYRANKAPEIDGFIRDDHTPEDGDLYVDTFTDGEINTERIVTNQFHTGDNPDTIEEKDGKLIFTRNKYIWYSAANGEPGVSIFANKDKSAYAGKFSLDFTLTKTRNIVRVQIGDNPSNANYLAQMEWRNDNLTVNYGDSQTETISVPASGELKVSLTSDGVTPRPKFTLSINGNTELTDVYSQSTDFSGISFVKFRTLIMSGYEKAGNYTIDDLAIRKVEDTVVPDPEPPVDTRTDEEKVDEDLALIDEDAILSVPLTKDGYLVDPLDLDTYTGITDNGTELSWESNNTDIISQKGSLTRPNNDTDVTVTLTAKLNDVIKQKSFNFKVAGTSADIAGMPTDIFPLYFDDFSDNTIDSRVKSSRFDTGDSVEEINGKLKFSRKNWSSSEASLSFYLDESKNTLSGEFVAEYTVNKISDVLRMRIINANWYYMAQVYWHGEDCIIYYRDEDLKEQNLILKMPGEVKAKFTIYTNLNSGRPKFTMWVNNELVLKDVYSCTDLNPGNVQWLQLYTLNYGNYGRNGGYTVDNFGYYRVMPEMSDIDRVKSDIDAITSESILKTAAPLAGTCYDDLNLVTRGKNGSYIKWTSSDEDIISLDGKVTRPENSNIPVTLVCEVSWGTAKLKKEIVMTVLGNHVTTGDIPTVEDMIWESDFESSELPANIRTNLAGGGTVEVKDGKLKVDKTASGSTAVIADIYNDIDGAAIATGLIGMEFDLESSTGGTVQFRSMDPNGNLYYSASLSSGVIATNYSNTPGVAGTSGTIWNGNGARKVHINMLFDTANSSYWVWVDGEQVLTRKYSRAVGVSSIAYTRFYLENVQTASIDNYKIYHAIPPKAMRLDFDIAKFGEKDILNEIPQAGNIIQSDLNLVDTLRYGTTITWESSHPDIINPATGKVTRPVDVSENPYVTLTAHMGNSGITATKKYSYYVLRDFSSESAKLDAEINDIKPEYLTNEDPGAIRTSLNLMEKGLYGSPIMWSSSNTSVITNAGRVIRPRFDEPDATVTLTASIGNLSKDITFTVLADEPPADPMYTSDEDFFGVWNGTSFNKTPQLNYSLEGMQKVENMAKAGNYAAAKEELYNYFLNRNVPSSLNYGTRLPGWVDSRVDGVYSLGEEGSYYRGVANITSDDYELVSVKLSRGNSISKAKKTFELIARYNESTSAYVLGTGADDPNMVPTLEVTVNGAVRTYKATDTATIRAGAYSGDSISDHKELIAKMYGDFLGDETYRILLQFDLSDIGSDDVISGAQLNFYARKSAPYADNKQLFVVDNAGNSWDEDTVYWDKLNFVLHNYNGLVGGYNWMGARGSDIEYAYQAPRMFHLRNTMTEYKYTGNEKYAYAIITQVMDLITDAKNQTPFPRSLDAGLRLQQFTPLMNAIITSPYCTPEFVTTFMKYIYSQFDYFPSRANATGNWREYEQLAVFHATSSYPELSNTISTRDASIESWKKAFSVSYLPDGTYVEDTGGYHRSSFAMYRDFKKAAVAAGVALPAEFDDTIHKATYYMRLLAGPAGESLAYGDESPGTVGAGSYKEIAQWYDDYILQYIDSLGMEGTEPEWTSYQFPDTTYTMMRSSWKKDAHYLFTNVRGNSASNGHGHPDDNGIIYFANGKRLLVDSGRFSYNVGDPARMYALSTHGHNTVVINDTSQRHSDNTDANKGTINTWTTNSDFDFSSQTSIAYAYHDHTRNILFVKDGFFIVSDLMTPDDSSKTDTYEQYWHMTPEAGITADTDKNQLRSNFDDGKNIILASADEVDTVFKDGYYESGAAVENKAGIFQKQGKGETTFDTVAYASKYIDAALDVERIDIGKPTNEATSIKFKLYENSTETTYYYMYNHKYTDGDTISFSRFTTDARVALVGIDSTGKLTDILYVDGSYIKAGNDNILSTRESVTDVSLKASNTRADIVSSDDTLEVDNITAKLGKNVNTVTVNSEAKEFSNTDGNIAVGTGKVDDVLVNDDNKHSGVGPTGGSQGGTPGGSGSQGGTGSVPGGNVTPPAVESTFTDIDAHWGKAEIEFLADKGIVNGNPDGTFKPDNTITRAEFIAIAMRAVGADRLDYQGIFSDVTSADWFAEDVQTALSIGVISEDVNFRPYDNITREEMSKILTLCSKYMAKKDNETKELSFTDTSSISPWAIEYVQYAYSNSLMNGRSDGSFDPQGDATRAEAAAVFARLIK